MHEQREQRDQIRRIEAIVQSKFMMDEDNLQSLLDNVPKVSLRKFEDDGLTPFGGNMLDTDDIGFKFNSKKAMTQRAGSLFLQG